MVRLVTMIFTEHQSGFGRAQSPDDRRPPEHLRTQGRVDSGKRRRIIQWPRMLQARWRFDGPRFRSRNNIVARLTDRADQGSQPGIRSRNWAQHGARSWSREDTRACSDKVFSRVGQSVAAAARMVRKIPMIASRSEVAKHCLHDRRVARRRVIDS